MRNTKTSLVPIQRSLLIASALLLAFPLLMMGWFHYRRPPRTDTQQQLFTGINYQRIVRNQPRPMMIHVVTIDLNQGNIKPIVTPARRIKSNQTIARTTSEFIQEFSPKLAINASYFQPFYENTPWDYYPRSGDRVGTLGENISNRQTYGRPSAGWHVICFLEDGRVQIPGTQTCPANTINGVAGSQILVLNGKIQPNTDTRADTPYSRLAIGVDATGKKLSLVAIDGKQPLYSEGITRYELAKFMQELNTDAALHLDGGGSTTLAINTPSGPQVLNSPVHAKIPTNERPVANHLGFVE